MPALTVLMATLAAANLGTDEDVFQLDARQAVFSTVQRYPDGSNMQGYKFTIAARPNGELPMWRQSLRDGALNIYVKAPNGQFAYYANTDTVEFASDSDQGVLLQPGEYFLVCSQFRGHLLGLGIWASLDTLSKYWTLPYQSFTFENVNIQGGGTSAARTFDIVARPDGSLPYISIFGDLYRRNGQGNFEVLCLTTRQSILLPAGKYALLGGTSPNQSLEFQQVARGTWVTP